MGKRRSESESREDLERAAERVEEDIDSGVPPEKRDPADAERVADSMSGAPREDVDKGRHQERPEGRPRREPG